MLRQNSMFGSDGLMSVLPIAKWLLWTCCTLLISSTAAQTVWTDSFRLDYNYDLTSSNGPDNWGNVVGIAQSEWDWYDNGDHPIFDLRIGSNRCGREFQVSPINLASTGDTACADTEEIFIRQKTDDDCQRDDMTFVITPQKLKAYFPLDGITCDRPFIEMDNFGQDEFIMVWMEMHVRSEHVIDGKRYDAELQMVHMGTGDNDGELAIVSLLIEANARRDNKDFQFLLNGWQRVANNRCRGQRELETQFLRKRSDLLSARERRGRTANSPQRPKLQQPESGNRESEPNDDTPIASSGRRRRAQCQADRNGQGCEPLGPRIRRYPYNMWPTIWYYSYQGSLTSPPCSSIVHWRIMDVPMQITRRQYKQLAMLLQSYQNDSCEPDTAVSPLGENYRPLQDQTSNQNVQHCTYDDFGFQMYEPEDQ